VVGDSPVEMEAIHLATGDIAGAYLVKTVKFVDSPTPQTLLGELRLLSGRLAHLAHASQSSSQTLVRKPTGDECLASAWTLDKGINWAQLAQVSEDAQEWFSL